ncbi:MAG: tetratricopeptide repeat protein, partial [Thermodesulfobacteriota bacterium]
AALENPEDAVARFELGILYKEMKEYRLAVPELRAAIMIRPDLVVQYLHLAEIYIEGNGYNEARLLLEKATALEPSDHRMKLRLAFVRAQLGLLSEAERDFKYTLASFPEWNEALSGLGNVYLLQGRLNDALKYFLLAIEANPKEPESLYNAALTLERLNRSREAIDYYERFVSTAPKGYEAAVKAANERIRSLKGF